MTRRTRRPELRWKKQAPMQPVPTNEAVLRALLSRAKERGQLLTELAREIESTYSMLDKWRSGTSLVARSTPQVQRAIANYLGLPRIYVLLASGAVALDDFTWPIDASLEAEVSATIDVLKKTVPGAASTPKDILAIAARTQKLGELLGGKATPSSVSLVKLDAWIRELAAGFEQPKEM